MSVTRACLSLAELGPVWMVLGSSAGSAVPSGGPLTVSVVIANVGAAHGECVRVRQAWHEGLGPVLAETDEIPPESEIALELTCTPEELASCSVVVEWRVDGVRRRHGVPLASLVSRPRLSAV